MAGIDRNQLDNELRLVIPRRKVAAITSAQLLALNATPITIVPSPAAGKVLLLEAMKVKYIPGTVEYTITAETAVTNRIVASVNLTNATLTIANQPLSPAYITYTIVDTTPSITAGIITVLGKDRLGNTISEVFDVAKLGLTARGLKVFSYVTSVITSTFTVLGGAGDETIVVGTETLSAENLALKYTNGSGQRLATIPSLGLFRGAEAAAANSFVVSVNLTNTTLTLVAAGVRPNFPVNVVAVVVDTTPSITAGFVIITGTDARGGVISETLTFTGAATKVSVQAFYSVTAVITKGFTVLGGAGDETITIGHTAARAIAYAQLEPQAGIMPVEGAALVLHMDTGEVTLGNGTLLVDVRYREEPYDVRLPA